MWDIEQEKKQALVKEARRIACKQTGQREFAFISKEQLALRLAELVAEVAQRDEYILILEKSERRNE